MLVPKYQKTDKKKCGTITPFILKLFTSQGVVKIRLSFRPHQMARQITKKGGQKSIVYSKKASR